MQIKKIFKSESGFTLIELLVVVGIIAILATIGAVNFAGARAKARDAKRIADIKQMQAAIEVEAAGSAPGTYPAITNLPAEITTISPPRTTDAYCYGVATNNYSYFVAVVGLEDQTNADSDNNPDEETAGASGTAVNATVTIITTGAGAPATAECTALGPAPAAGECSDADTYCLVGTTAP